MRRLAIAGIAAAVLLGSGGVVATDLPDATLNEGDREGGMPKIKFVLEWPDGMRYEGDLRSGLPHGYGVVTLPNGVHYEGGFRWGEIHGLGVLNRLNRPTYLTEFRDGQAPRYRTFGMAEMASRLPDDDIAETASGLPDDDDDDMYGRLVESVNTLIKVRFNKHIPPYLRKIHDKIHEWFGDPVEPGSDRK